jgi:hypothetical protein
VHNITARQQVSGWLQSADSAAEVITIDAAAPTAVATAGNLVTPGQTYTFTVTYSDNVAIDPATLSGNNLTVTGPGYAATASLLQIDNSTPGTPRTATYEIASPPGGWSSANDGLYTITLGASQVFDTAGNAAGGGTVGTFNVLL